MREDARRPLAENLAEGLALSEFLCTFTGQRQAQLSTSSLRLRLLLEHLLAMKRASDRARDHDDIRALEAAQEEGEPED